MDKTPEAYTRGILAAVLEPWIEALAKANAAYQTDGKLRAQLDDAAVEATEKAALIDSVLPQGIAPEMRNFLKVLATNEDFGFVDEIAAQLTRIFTEEAGGPQHAVVISAMALSEDVQERIRQRLIKQFGANLEFTYQVDSEILGGLIVQVGDKLIDDSVRGRLDALRNSLGVRTV